MTPVVAESREVRNWRIANEIARQLSAETGIDGYAALAVVLDVDWASRRKGRRCASQAWASAVKWAGIRAIRRTSGLARAELRFSAASARMKRATAAFQAEVFALYFEMDDEFRQITDHIAD